MYDFWLKKRTRQEKRTKKQLEMKATEEKTDPI
jgi:hypothetical protein